MDNSDTCFAYPCYCTVCNSLVNANMLDRPLFCPKCSTSDLIPYDDLKLNPVGNKQVGGDRVSRLKDGQYFCPGCKCWSLRFSGPHGFWD